MTYIDDPNAHPGKEAFYYKHEFLQKQMTQNAASDLKRVFLLF